MSVINLAKQSQERSKPTKSEVRVILNEYHENERAISDTNDNARSHAMNAKIAFEEGDLDKAARENGECCKCMALAKQTQERNEHVLFCLFPDMLPIDRQIKAYLWLKESNKS